MEIRSHLLTFASISCYHSANAYLFLSAVYEVTVLEVLAAATISVDTPGSAEYMSRRECR
jgi:hypothetical protein